MSSTSKIVDTGGNNIHVMHLTITKQKKYHTLSSYSCTYIITRSVLVNQRLVDGLSHLNFIRTYVECVEKKTTFTIVAQHASCVYIQTNERTEKKFQLNIYWSRLVKQRITVKIHTDSYIQINVHWDDIIRRTDHFKPDTERLNLNRNYFNLFTLPLNRFCFFSFHIYSLRERARARCCCCFFFLYFTSKYTVHFMQ